jgi:hypothetical protein
MFPVPSKPMFIVALILRHHCPQFEKAFEVDGAVFPSNARLLEPPERR